MSNDRFRTPEGDAEAKRQAILAEDMVQNGFLGGARILPAPEVDQRGYVAVKPLAPEVPE